MSEPSEPAPNAAPGQTLPPEELAARSLALFEVQTRARAFAPGRPEPLR